MRLKFLVFLVLFLVIGGLGAYLWYRRFRPITPYPDFQPPIAYRADPSQLVQRIDELTNPFLTPPCFVTATNTCQLIFIHPPEYGENRLEIRSFKAAQQSGPTQFLPFGQMLVARNALTQHYLDTLIGGAASQPYLDFVHQLPGEAATQQLNPSFIYAVYEHLFAVTSESPINSPLAPPELSVQKIGESYQEGSNLLAVPGSADILIAALQNKDWSPEAKALTYALAKNLAPEVVIKFLAEEGALERRYLATFAPPELESVKRVEYAGAAVGLTQLYSDENKSWQVALCRNGLAQACRVEDEALLCSPVPQFNEDCRLNLLDL